jgi:bifunctional UDP-N-acetylglucosamine pyrophosphorylase/glucosamine-1-phosphate N-acetyltransferase
MTQARTIILAAGKGTRMKSDKPKVLHSLCGKAMIDYVVNLARSVGSLTYVVLGHQSQVVKAYLGPKMNVVYQKRLLGTADAIKAVLPRLKGYRGNVVILCGDAPLLKKESLKHLLKRHSQAKAVCTFLTVHLEDPTGYGRVIRDLDNHPVAIREEKDASEDEKDISEINTGIYCFDTESLRDALKRVALNTKKKEYYLTDVIAVLAGQGKKAEALVLKDDREGLGINTHKDLAMASVIMRERILDALMLSGVRIVDPKTTYIDSGVKIGRDTVINPCTVLEHDVVIGQRCSIGPFCHLRPKTRIKDEACVGNFAEISRSSLGARSLMKHFSFLGDATVGPDVNIGAGVVTANYDGKNKNKTSIARGAFIGSDSILVAPVTIGEKAMTGAGCVVTRGKKVPKGQVILGVPGKIIKRERRP